MYLAQSVRRSMLRTSSITSIALAGILSLGIVLRLLGLGTVGPVGDDPHTYLNTGRLIATGFDAIVLRSREFSELEGYLIHVPRPLHALLIGAVMVVTRNDQAIWAGHLVGALFGSCTIVIVYILGRHISGVAVGLVGSAMFAVSAYSVHYSRSALAEADANFFMTLTLLLLVFNRHMASRKRQYWMSYAVGLSAALAMAVNFRLIWLPCVILLFTGIQLVSRVLSSRGGRITFPDVLPFIFMLLGILSPLILYGIPSYLLARLLNDPFNHAVALKWSYLHQLFHWLFVMNISGGIQPDMLFFPRLWVMSDGILPISLLCVGTFIVIRQRSRNMLIVLSIIAVPYVIHSTTAYHASRYFSILLPGIAIICGHSICVIPKRIRLRCSLVLVGIIGIVGCYVTWDQLSFSPAPYQIAAREMKATGISEHFTDSEPASRFWFTKSHVFPLDNQDGTLSSQLVGYECGELEVNYALLSLPSHIQILKDQGAVTIMGIEFPVLPSVLSYFEDQGRFNDHLESYRKRSILAPKSLLLMRLCDPNP